MGGCRACAARSQRMREEYNRNRQARNIIPVTPPAVVTIPTETTKIDVVPISTIATNEVIINSNQ